MLTVLVSIRPSRIHGMGLFAAQDIKEGEVVWRFESLVDMVLNEEQMESLSGPCRQQLLHYAAFADGEPTHVGYLPCPEHPNAKAEYRPLADPEATACCAY